MSGEELRYVASQGNHLLLKSVLRDRANPCSTDEYGLTPLMFAVFNGHVECVKLLACNNMGVTLQGVKRSALDMQSLRGFTALHLVCIDSPQPTRKLICTILLIAGVDPNIKSNDDPNPTYNMKTALEIAKAKMNVECLEAFDEFDRMQTDPETKAKIVELSESLKEYYFDRNLRLQVKPFDSEFAVPDFIFDKQRAGSIHDKLILHEHQILPLVHAGDKNKKGVDAIKCLLFAAEQAEKNQMRRAVINKASDESWEPVDVNPKRLYEKKEKSGGRRRGGKGGK